MDEDSDKTERAALGIVAAIFGDDVVKWCRREINWQSGALLEITLASLT
jgi:hypothetical protein